MFILDKSKFGDFELENVRGFIEFWSYYYKDTAKDETGKIISYIEELNLNNDLTKQNVVRLLRWKDPLQEPKGIENNIFDIVKRLKEVDNALFAYGQFLETYNKTTEEKNDETPLP